MEPNGWKEVERQTDAADNRGMAATYIHVRKISGKYVLSVGGAKPPRAKRGDQRFDDLAEAMEVACDDDRSLPVKCSAEVDNELRAVGR